MNQGSTHTKDDTDQESSDVTLDVETLREHYQETDGNIAAVARRINYSSGHTRQLLIEAGIHENEGRGLSAVLEESNPEDLGLGKEAVL